MNGSTHVKVVLALHAHLPYIRIPDRKFPLQELWLFQAITETYIPLLQCFNELIEEKISFNITISLSPTLISMLSDEYYKRKYHQYLGMMLELLRKKSANSNGEEKSSLLSLLNNLQSVSNYYIEIKEDILRELRKLSESGHINLITTSATHALLPLFRFSEDFIGSQIGIGQAVFEKAFGFVPEGFWLPEMGYCANLDKMLGRFNIKYTFLEAHSVYLTKGSPSYGNFYPSITESGLKIFPRELHLSNVIWSAKSGYPGDPRYREFHFDYIYSLSDTELNEFGLDRIPFGLKIYKITGGEKPKEFYNNREAAETARAHADDFVARIRERAATVRRHMHRNPVFTLPFDAELFGHWWYEGPVFLKHVIRNIASSPDIDLIQPADINGSELDIVAPAESSWGRGGYFKSWINPECSWIYPKLALLDARYKNIISDKVSEASAQAIKELLLASSSDWPFLIANETSVDYGRMRLEDHINTAKKILDEIEAGNVDEKFLHERASLYPLFGHLH
ncbi:MAG: 1,4-alpha-glucan branching protein domain-containing protein [Spirochaetota bacterium]